MEIKALKSRMCFVFFPLYGPLPRLCHPLMIYQDYIPAQADEPP